MHINHIKILDFIVLIHPTQWTIAIPVGADRPPKQQKNHTGFPPVGPASTVHSLGGALYFLCRHLEIIVSFCFGTCTVPTDL